MIVTKVWSESESYEMVTFIFKGSLMWRAGGNEMSSEDDFMQTFTSFYDCFIQFYLLSRGQFRPVKQFSRSVPLLCHEAFLCFLSHNVSTIYLQ